MEVWPPGGEAVVLLVVGGAPVSRVVSAPAEAAAEPKVAVTEAGAGAQTHRPDTEAGTEAECPRGWGGDPGGGHCCGCGRGPVLAVVLRLTILQVVAPVPGEAVSTDAVPPEAGGGSGADRTELEAEPETEMSWFLKGGGENLWHVSCLAGEKLKLGDLSLDLKCLVPELLGVNELLLVQEVPGGGRGQAEAEAKDDQILHCVSVSAAELMTTHHLSRIIYPALT